MSQRFKFVEIVCHGQIESRVPVMQVDDVGRLLERPNPARGGYAEKCEFVGVGRKWSIAVLAEIDKPGTLSFEQGVMQDDMLDTCYADSTPDLDIQQGVTKRHWQCGYALRSRCGMQNAIGRRGDGHVPAFTGQRPWQVAHDIAYTTDFSARQGAVLGCEEYDVPRNDTARPIVCDAVVARAYRE